MPGTTEGIDLSGIKRRQRRYKDTKSAQEMDKRPSFLGKRTKIEFGGGIAVANQLCSSDDLRTGGFEKCGGLTTTEDRRICQSHSTKGKNQLELTLTCLCHDAHRSRQPRGRLLINGYHRNIWHFDEKCCILWRDDIRQSEGEKLIHGTES